ncbi:HNH endonuclease [Marisediminicola sp. UYEF4]|uniref:HNH endonuclease n=1 Tax=Marisediminicola sp. UYEF4 TaxID=1756384 RepID=UPI003394C283
MTDRVRSAIMRRDNYPCRMCGASRVDGTKLHVDHMRPVSRDGLTEESNLQTLCEACNLGKSNVTIG